MVDREPSSTTPELLSVQAIELEMPAPGIWGDRELDDRTTGLMLISVRFLARKYQRAPCSPSWGEKLGERDESTRSDCLTRNMC
jgi:hypothetical protein